MMKNKALIFGLTFFLFNVANTQAQTPHHSDDQDPNFQIAKTSNQLLSIEEVLVPEDEMESIAPSEKSLSINEMFQQGINPMAIADIISKLWDIIKEGKPVVNVNYQIAKALPIISDGNWQKLVGWKSERVATYGFTATNLWGVKTIDMSYQVRMRYGGSMDCKGQYIAHAYAKPTKVSVSWGYNLDVSVSIPSIVNLGSEDDPLAAINMDVTYKISTMMKDYTESKSFEFHGDGELKSDGHTIFEADSR